MLVGVRRVRKKARPESRRRAALQ